MKRAEELGLFILCISEQNLFFNNIKNCNDVHNLGLTITLFDPARFEFSLILLKIHMQCFSHILTN